MTDNIKLPPLPEWTKRDDLDGLLPSEVRVEMFTYLRANMEPLRQKLRRLTFELDAATICGNDRGAHYQQAEARADKLAEAPRELHPEIRDDDDEWLEQCAQEDSE